MQFYHPTDEELAEIRRLFRYDADRGVLLSRSTGKPVRKNNGRYIQVRFSGRQVVGHRVVWYLHHGEWPVSEIDHEDCDGFNNDHRNLRLADRSTNCQNVRGPKVTNALGVLGVRRQKGKFRAGITVRGQHRDLGLFDTPEVAGAAYLTAKREMHPYGRL